MSSAKRYLNGPETDRLRHRAFKESDAPAFFALNGDPLVMRHTGEPLLGSVEEARDALRNYSDFEVYGYGRWAIELKESGQVIGFSGMKYLDDVGVTDIGYRLIPDHWGQGLATESCKACLSFGLEIIGLEAISAFVLPGNRGSIRVLEKCGMHRLGLFQYDEEEVIHYSTDKESTLTPGTPSDQ